MIRAGRAGLVMIAGVATAGIASAGGPLVWRADGELVLWSTATAIQYRTDNGPLSASVSESQARARVQAMFDVWQDVPSSSIRYNRAGFITGVGDGDVSTANEFNAAANSCDSGQQSPIIYDAAAQIIGALGIDETSVIGFTSVCGVDSSQALIVSALVVMNGLFQDGNVNPVPDLTAAKFNATFIHEFGHFSGLDHSQINVGCAHFACSADDLAGLPTMFPFLVSAQQGSLSVDDVAWISKFYPAGGASGFAATHGTITGTVLYSDGESHVQAMNVIARRVDTGANQDRRFAASAVSGFRFRLCTPNPITNPPQDDCSTFGIADPEQIGFYEIPAPPGSYTVEVEAIDPGFVEGSGVGPLRIQGQRPLPGTAPPPIGPITVTAGQTTAGHDVALIGTPPRFDAFEGP
jgi:hypothetical protein